MNFWTVVLAVMFGHVALGVIFGVIRGIEAILKEKKEESVEKPKPVTNYTTYRDIWGQKQDEMESETAEEVFADLQSEITIAQDMIDRLNMLKADCKDLLHDMKDLRIALADEKKKNTIELELPIDSTMTVEDYLKNEKFVHESEQKAHEELEKRKYEF